MKQLHAAAACHCSPARWCWCVQSGGGAWRCRPAWRAEAWGPGGAPHGSLVQVRTCVVRVQGGAHSGSGCGADLSGAHPLAGGWDMAWSMQRGWGLGGGGLGGRTAQETRATEGFWLKAAAADARGCRLAAMPSHHMVLLPPLGTHTHTGTLSHRTPCPAHVHARTSHALPTPPS